MPDAGPPTTCPLAFPVWAVVVPVRLLAVVLPEADAFWLAPVD